MSNFTDGSVVHATDLNGLLKLVGGSAVSGTPPAFTTSAGFQLCPGTAVLVTNGSGGFSVNFPVSFPNGLMVVVPTAGDNSLPNITLTLIQSQKDKTHFGGIAYSAGTAINTATVRIDYIPIGF